MMNDIEIGTGQAEMPDQAVRRRGEESGSAASSSASGATNNPDTQLPRCEPFPLTVPSEVPAEVHASPQIVIAHRGASAHLPEHSLEGYRLALELGADYIEPDLVATADHHLIAMHSLDLAVTTNVEEVFGASKSKTVSKYKRDRMDNDDAAMGYWVYDFTLEEIKQLRLKQRLGGPENNGRTKAFDGLFQVPTLTEILELLDDWNENIQPLWYHDINNEDINNDSRQPHRYPPPPRGLYAELKDFPWLLKDADIDLIDLFFDHIDTNNEVWEKAIFRHMCSTKRLKEQEYKLPPLIMQSFEAEVLKNFTHRWEEISNNQLDNELGNGSNSTTSLPDLTYEISLVPSQAGSEGEGEGSQSTFNQTAHIPLPAPPTILLVTHDNCLDEKFWFELEGTYRKVITGIGPDKMCFFESEVSSTAEVPEFRYLPTVAEKAKELNWIVHPWTERPEHTFFATTVNPPTRRRMSQTHLSPFENVLEEVLFLKCTAGVHGVFSESVDVAVRAMGMSCPGDDKAKHASFGTSSGTNSFDKAEIPLIPVIGFSFLSGILAALLAWKYICGGGAAANNDNGQQRPQSRRAPRIPGRRVSNLPPHLSVPTEADDVDDDAVVLPDNNREVL